QENQRRHDEQRSSNLAGFANTGTRHGHLDDASAYGLCDNPTTTVPTAARPPASRPSLLRRPPCRTPSGRPPLRATRPSDPGSAASRGSVVGRRGGSSAT